MKKAARFFCDNCGAEVPLAAPECPACGRPFSAVRCPQCGFSGGEAAFKAGCPACGRPGSTPSPPPADNSAAPLPLWVYAVSILAFLAALAALVVTVLRG
ncbi:MAG: hypothetical protein MdMp014T_2429 [Treponematales bacterium]